MKQKPNWIRANPLDARGIPVAGAMVRAFRRQGRPALAPLAAPPGIPPQGASNVALAKYPG